MDYQVYKWVCARDGHNFLTVSDDRGRLTTCTKCGAQPYEHFPKYILKQEPQS